MLWSQFSAFFDIFRRKIWRFSLNSNVVIEIFVKIAVFLTKNHQIFAKIFEKF
jgi:hypothetical protein